MTRLNRHRGGSAASKGGRHDAAASMAFAFDDIERHHPRHTEPLPRTARADARRAACREIARRALPGLIILPVAVALCGLLDDQHLRAPVAFAAILALSGFGALARALAIRHFLSHPSQPGRRAQAGFFISALLLPMTWGCYSAWLLTTVRDGWLGMAMLSFTAAIASSAVVSFGMWYRLALCTVLVTGLPVLIAGSVIGGGLGIGLVFGCLAFGVYLSVQLRNWNRFFWASQLNAALLEVRSRELERAKEAAESANRAKSEFLTRMSHELRTPMNAVLGFAQLIELQTPADSPLHEHGSEIRAAGQHLMALIEEILDLSRIEAGKLALQRERLDLCELTRATVNSFAAALDGRTVELHLELPAGAPIVGDPLRVRQVLLNVIGNAVKFTEQGRIDITLHDTDDLTCLVVSDTGPGIPPELIEQVFAPFVQVDPALSRRGEGTGLGLPIARHLLAMMGGRIEVSSRLGAGSQFRLYFPRARVRAEAPPPAAALAGG